MKLLFTLSILLLTACTITKRHFGVGYHVEWKSSISSKRPNSESIVIDSISNAIVEIKPFEHLQAPQSNMDIPAANTIEKPISIEQSAPYPGNSKNDQLTSPHVVITSLEEDHMIQNLEDQKENPETTPKRMNKNTWISLLFFFLLVIMTAIFSISGFLLTVGAGAVLFGLALGMFITSLIAVIQIMRNPDRYKNRALSFTIFFFSCTFLFVGLVLFLATIVSETNFI